VNTSFFIGIFEQMKDTLLTAKHKKTITKSIGSGDYEKIISILDSISTKHAGTARMKDKRYVMAEIASHINNLGLKDPDKEFFLTGKKILAIRSENAKEIGIHTICRGYKFNKDKVTEYLYKITNDSNWEVREYAAGALSAVLKVNPGFIKTLKKWSKDKSENIRRGVVLAACGLRDLKDPTSFDKALTLLEPLLKDPSRYVRVNLGPFILGGYYGNHFPEKIFRLLDRIIKSDNENVKWNAAMIFNNSFGNRHPNEAVKYLRILAKDESPAVQRAVRSTINNLRKRHKNINL
jgi:HEAT repeat